MNNTAPDERKKAPVQARDSHPVAWMGNDAELFARFVAGDNEAFVELYNRHKQRLYTYCTKMVNAHVAQDLSDEAWSRMIECRRTQRTLENPVGFLMRIARNLCLDHLRYRQQMVSLDSADMPEETFPPAVQHESSEMEELVVKALKKLSFEYREVLVLNAYCGYSFEEIASIIGKSSQAVWTRASRARAQLRKMLRSESAASRSVQHADAQRRSEG